MLPQIEAVTRRDGRSVIQEWIEQQPSDDPRVDAPTGFGSVPRDHVARFLLRHRFTLEQFYRVSHLELSTHMLEHVAELLDQARAASADYRLVQWTLPTAPERASHYAWMKSRMSTDAPSAGLETDEEKRDVARLPEK